MSSHRSVGLKQVHTVLLLRWVLIIATAYLVLFSRPLAETPPSVALFVAAYLGSNVVLTRLGGRIRSWKRLDIGVVLFDTAAVCVGLGLSANAAVDFFPVYFLVVFVGALTEQLWLVVAAAVLISVVHLSTLSTFVDFNHLIDRGYILRVPFLFVVALFFGYLVQDARSRQRAEKARARALRRTEVLSTVTHDLKNPLGTIQSLAGLLLDDSAGALNHQQTDLVRRIHANAGRVIQLSVNLLDAARINAGRLRLQRRPSNLSHIVEDAVSLARTAGDLKGVALQFSADPSLPAADVDGLQVGRVISNLVDNTIKYTPGGGTVDVSTRWAADHLVVEVRDNGPGIPAKEISLLFEKYQRGAVAGRVEGTGLGLFIVKAVVQAHGGTVEMDSRPGHGTVVRVCFPTAHNDLQQACSTTVPVPRPAGWGQFSTGVASTS